MPFVNNNSKTVITTTSMITDTTNTLLALAGKLNNTNYLNDIPTSTTQSGGVNSNFLVQFLKPATFMFSSMMHFFFGSTTANTTQLADVEFKFKKPLPLAFLVVTGGEVSKIKQMLLTGIESVYGTNVTQCIVKDNNPRQLGYISVKFKTDTTKTNGGYKFVDGVPSSSSFSQSKVFSSGLADSYYTVLQPTVKQFLFVKTYTINLSTKDWLGWCRRNQGEQSSIIGSLFGNFLQLFSPNPSNPTRAQAIDTLLHNLGFTVESYEQNVHSNLILDLKDAQNFQVGQPGTTTHFQLINVIQGAK